MFLESVELWGIRSRAVGRFSDRLGEFDAQSSETLPSAANEAAQRFGVRGVA